LGGRHSHCSNAAASIHGLQNQMKVIQLENGFGLIRYFQGQAFDLVDGSDFMALTSHDFDASDCIYFNSLFDKQLPKSFIDVNGMPVYDIVVAGI
jgi:hypothetical protein